jgi:hypothetical protein
VFLQYLVGQKQTQTIIQNFGGQTLHRALHCAGPTDSSLHQIDDRE